MVTGSTVGFFRHIIKASPGTLITAVLLAGILALTVGIDRAPAGQAERAANAPSLLDTVFAETGNTITLNVREAYLQDVLSALAIKMGANIVLLDSKPVKVTFKVENVSPRRAMELIIQSSGLSYLQSGSVIIIGPADKLQQNFFNHMALTRFDTRYIESDEIQNMINKLGIKGVKTIIKDDNPHAIWVQGTAQALDKVRELISAVDIEKEPFEEKQSRFFYTLEYTAAGEAAEKLKQFGFGDNVKAIIGEGDKFGRELLVLCPKDIEGQVMSALDAIDMPVKKTRVPLLTERGENAHQRLNATRHLLSELSGVPVGSLHISRNLGSRDNPLYVLWVEETPDKSQLLKNLVDEMDLN
uniref:hypothetical protein n=1 Tax=Desulforadius tongensis TaxID=1216062 RepID=UPI003B75C556